MQRAISGPPTGLPAAEEAKRAEDEADDGSSARLGELERSFVRGLHELGEYLTTDMAQLKLRCATKAVEELCLLAQIHVAGGKQGPQGPLDDPWQHLRQPRYARRHSSNGSRTSLHMFRNSSTENMASQLHANHKTTSMDNKHSPDGKASMFIPPTALRPRAARGSVDMCLEPDVKQAASTEEEEAQLMAEMLTNARRGDGIGTPTSASVHIPGGRRTSVAEGVAEMVLGKEIAKRLFSGSDGLSSGTNTGTSTPVSQGTRIGSQERASTDMSRAGSANLFFPDTRSTVRQSPRKRALLRQSSSKRIFFPTGKKDDSWASSVVSRGSVLKGSRTTSTEGTEATDHRRHSIAMSEAPASESSGFLGNAGIHPESERLFWWQILVIMLVLETAIEVPYSVGFNSEPVPKPVTILFELVFIVDVCLNFWIGYVDEFTHDVILDVRLTAKKYFRTFFLVDLCASIPSEIIAELSIGGDGLGDVRVIRALRMIKIFRLVRLLRLDPFKDVEGETMNPAVLRLLKLLCMFVFVLHVIACGYWFLARTEWAKWEEGQWEWETGDWGPPEQIQKKEWWEQYAYAYHWAILITIGNDARPVTYAENMYSGLIMITGIGVFASIIGGASSLLSQLDINAREEKQQMDAINHYLRFRRVPTWLRVKIRNYYKYLWLTGQALHHKQLFDHLPQTLSLQLNLALKRKLIETSALFHDCEPVSVVAVIRRLISFVAIPEQRVVTQGDRGSRVYFIVRGACCVLVKQQEDGQEFKINTLGEGAHFGEMGVLVGGERTATVMAETFCMMEMLLGEDFLELLETYPDISAHMMKVAEKRKEREAFSIQKFNAQTKNDSGPQIKNWRQNSSKEKENSVKSKNSSDPHAEKFDELTRHALTGPGEDKIKRSSAEMEVDKLANVRAKWAEVTNANVGSHRAKDKFAALAAKTKPGAAGMPSGTKPSGTAHFAQSRRSQVAPAPSASGSSS